MLQILLTGASGFLGQTLQQKLKEKYILTSLSRVGSDINCNLEEYISPFHKTFDIVIHSAGKAHCLPKSQLEVQDFYKVNVKGTENLLKALEFPRKPKSFVFISSVAVYGLNKGTQINENSPLLAKDPYGLSKIQAEKLVQEWCIKHDVIFTILRLPLISGPNPPGNLGKMIRGIQKGYYFNINGGKARKSMILAEDVAKFVTKVAEIGGVYNLTDGHHPNFGELSLLISRQSGKSKVLNMPLFLANIAAKIGDLAGKYSPFNTEKLDKITSTLTFDDSKARTIFGWNPTPVLEGFKITEK